MNALRPWSGFKRWLIDRQQRSLARLTPMERADIDALDAAVKRHSWRFASGFVTLWLVLTAVVKAAAAKLTWPGALMLSGILLGATTFALVSVWFGASRVRATLKSMAMIVMLAWLGAVSGGFIARLAAGGDLAEVLTGFARVAPHLTVGGLVVGLVIAAAMTSIAQYRRSQLLRQNLELARQASAERMGRQLADAKLKLMQAQVEPHFLFNTLASVQQLAEGRAPEAATLTSQLIVFLRAGLASLREDSTTLKREFAAIGAYLDIMKTRLGDRFDYSLSLPSDHASLTCPPAMLISLVENAIKHGIEPSTEFATLNIAAKADADTITLTVADTGIGPNTRNSGGGVGLDNIRQRLKILYSGAAHLTVRANTPHGFHATIVIPLAAPQTQHDSIESKGATT
jgi:signal transduction histidine kinase